MARLARSDVNMPNFDGFPVATQASEVLFEAAVYKILRFEPAIRASHLLHYRAPVQYPGPRHAIPWDLSGRRLFVFERAEGKNNVWNELSEQNKVWT